MLNITILRPQEIPPSARKLLTEPRPNSVGPVEVKATGWAEVGRLKLNTEHSEHPLDLTQRTGKQICFSHINHPICGIESASFNSYVKLPEGTSYRDGFKVHTCTMLRKLHLFLKKTTTIPYLNKSGDEHPFIPVIFRIGIPGICPIPGKMTKRTVFFWFMDQQNMKDATINAITSLKRWIWGYSEYSIRVCSCVCIYILCIDDDTYMYIGQTMLAGDGMEMKPMKSTRHNLFDNTSQENAMSIRSKRQFPVCRMCFHLSQHTI